MSSSFKHKQRSCYSYRNDVLQRSFHISQHKVSRVVREEEKSFFKKFVSSMKRFFLRKR